MADTCLEAALAQAAGRSRWLRSLFGFTTVRYAHQLRKPEFLAKQYQVKQRHESAPHSSDFAGSS